MRLVLASNNAKKLSELQQMLQPLGVALVTQGSLGIAEAEEPHATFIENALAKARHASAAAQAPAIADDSGVCVPALGGAPGVASAVYAPLPADAAAHAAGGDREALRRLQDAANNALLLQRLRHLSADDDRRAYFSSTLVAVRHATDPEPLVAVGRWPGRILAAPRGTLGFGYDPLMYIAELDATVAELPPEIKNRHSHRARAMLQMQALLHEVWRW
jgi:XTP/dITP diphosphohydrolase